MSILNIVTNVTGLAGVEPSIIYVDTNDTIGTITTVGYLNQAKAMGASLSNEQMAIVISRVTPDAQPVPNLLQVSISAGVYSFVDPYSPGTVVTPTIANHIAYFNNNSGRITDAAANIINAGNISAGLAGTPGKFISFPATGNEGVLMFAALNNSGGNFDTTVTNASSIGQTQVISIPDSGASAANFMLSKSGGTQHITVGSFEVDAGDVIVGLPAGGTAGRFLSYSATGSKGALILAGIANTGNTNVTISNAAHGQASVYSIPDSGASTANFILSKNASIQHITAGSFQVDNGNIVSGISSGGVVGAFTAYPTTASSGVLALSAVTNAGGDFDTIISNASSIGQDQVISIPDSGAATASFLLSSKAAGQTVASSTASATPGTIRALVGAMTESNATMVSGNVVGVRGSVNLVSASGGFVYGLQGKVIPSGTLSGSVWAPAVFGQYDLTNATLNAGQIAAIWGDMGAVGGVFTDVTGARMFAGTNTIASLTLNSMIYLYGKSSNLFELSGNAGTYITSGGAGAPGGTVQKIAITIDGTPYYIVASTTVS